MSNSLLKSGWTQIDADDVRIIDNSELIENRVKEALKKDHGGSNGLDGYNPDDSMSYDGEYEGGEYSEGGFQSGLYAETLEGYSDEQGEASPVIKAQPQEPYYDGPSPEELLEEAREEIARMREEAQLEIEEARNRAVEDGISQGIQQGRDQGIQEGRDEGYRIGYEEGMASADEHIAEQKLLLEKEYQKRLDVLEPLFVEKITAIYEHVFHINLESLRDVVIGLLSACIQKVDSSRNYLIHASKEDYPYVSMQKKLLQEEIGIKEAVLEIVEDATLKKNQCMIETDMGIYDCSLDLQLADLKKELQLLSYSE